MADAASGGDEIKRIILRAEALNFSGTQREVLALNQALKDLANTLKSGGALNKAQISDINKELDRLENTAKSAGAKTTQTFDSMQKSAEKLQSTMKQTAQMTGVNFTGKTQQDAKALRAYNKELDLLGVGLVAKPKYFAQVVQNVQRTNQALKTGQNAGIATKQALDAVSTGQSATMPMVTAMQRLSISAGVARKGLEGVITQMKFNAKQAQWTGLQMTEGITVPLVGVGVAAIRTFDSVNKEMIQLKKVTEYKEDYADLEDQMIRVAEAYGMSLKASASLFTDVAALGKSGKDIGEWSDSIAKLSMVGDIDSKGAMEFFRVINAIFTDGSISQTNEILAQLSAISDETSLQLRDLAAAFPEVAPVMQQMGFSAAGIASSLAGMYRRGIPATEAAHGLKFALQRLVVPTKDASKIIDELGFSFTDANGKVGDGSIQIMRLAEQLNSMNDAQRLAAAPELFGGRQSARMNSYFADVALGNEEYRKLTAGIIKVNEVQSDFLRGMIASGEIPVEGIVKATDRYAKAVEEIKKDPSKALARIKTQFQVVSYEIGKSLAPAIITLGEKITDLLKKFTDSPAFIQKMALAFGALIAVIGPIRYLFAQARYVVSSFGEVLVKMLPKIPDLAGGIGQAMGLMKMDQARKDIFILGDRVGMLTNIGWVNKLKLKLGIMPKFRGEALRLFEEMQSGIDGVANSATSADGRAIASNSLLQASEDEVSDEFDETARAAARRVAATDSIVSANSRLTVSNAATKASEGISSGIPMPPVRKPLGLYPTPMPAKTGGKVTDLTAIPQFSDATEKQLDKILKLKERLKLIDGVEADLTAKKIAQMQISSGLTDDIIAKTLAHRAAQNALADSAKNAGKGMLAITEKSGEFADEAAQAAVASKGLFSTLFGGGPVTWAILAAIAAIVASIAIGFLLLKDRWEQIKAIIEPSLNKLKQAFDNVKKSLSKLWASFSSLLDIFKSVVGQLGSGENAAESFGSTAGNALSGIIDFFAEIVQGISYLIDIVAELIQYFSPVFETIGYIVKDTIGAIVSLLRGDLVGALQFVAARVYEHFRPYVVVYEAILQQTAYFVSTVISLLSQLANLLVKNPIGNGLKSISGSVENWANELDVVGSLDARFRSGLGGLFGSATTEAAKEDTQKVVDAGDNLGGEFAGGFNDAVESGVGSDWLKDWLSQIKSVLDSQLGELRQSAIDSLKKAHEESLKIYDERTQAIEDQEKAEEKLLKAEEYIAKRRELLQKREFDRLNYRNSRALAVYEGRFNDVRMLDLEERRSISDSNKQIEDLDRGHQKDLAKEQREALKDQIKNEKDAAKERFDIQEESFKDSLDLITKYAPKTVEEYNKMLQDINSLLNENGVSAWPEMAKNGMQRFQDAFNEASSNIREDFAWSGESAATAWMEGFAPDDVIAILKSKLSGGAGAGAGAGGLGSGLGDLEGGGGSPSLPEPKLDSVFSGLGDFIKKWWGEITLFLMKPGTGIASVIGSVIGKLLRDVDWGGIGSTIWEGIKKAFGSVAGFFSGLFDGASGGIAEALDPIVGTVQNVFSTVFNTVESILDPIVGTVQTIFGKVVNVVSTLGDVFKSVFGVIKNVIKTVWTNTISPIFNFIGQIIVGYLVPVFQMLIGIFQMPFMALKHALSVAWDFVKPVFESIWGWITNSLIPTFFNFKNTADDVWGSISGIISSAWTGFLEPIFKSVWNTISGVLTPVFNSLKNTIAIVWYGITSAIAWAWGAIQPIFGGIQWFAGILAGAFTWLWGKMSEIWNGIKSTISTVWNSISGTITSVWNGIIDTVAGVWNWIAIKIENVINGFIDKYNGLPGFLRPWTINKVDLPEIRRAQGGPMEGTGFMGAVNKPLYLVGEGRSSYPEYVIPTDPAYRNQASQLLNKAASAIGAKAGAVNASIAGAGSSITSAGGGGATISSSEQNVYISVDTFIGEEQWFAELSKKYNMKMTPKERKVAGQQKRVISSYNDRYKIQ